MRFTHTPSGRFLDLKITDKPIMHALSFMPNEQQMTLEQLPTFTVTAIAECHATVSFDNERWIGENHIACVVVDSMRFIWGRLAEVDLSAGNCIIVADQCDELATLSNGQSYPRLDGYWGERAELVLDRSKKWEERTFTPVDAVAFTIDGGNLVRKVSDGPTAEGDVVKGGWDHEHCEICWATISRADNPTGIFAEPKHWICCDCYQRFVLPASLEFIVEHD